MTKIWIQQTSGQAPAARADQAAREEPTLQQEHQTTAEYSDVGNLPLFPDGAKPEHVKQGSLGNCFLLAALASITKTDSGYPRKIVRDNNNGTVTVRLFEHVQVSSFEHRYVPHQVMVKKSVVKRKSDRADMYAQGALWVQMIEKGYVAGNFGGKLTGEDYLLRPIGQEPSSYEKIHAGGISAHAFSVFTGKDSEYHNTQDENRRQNLDRTQILTMLKSALDSNQAIAVGTRKLVADETAEGVGGSAGEAKRQGIVAGHAYSVTDIDVDGGKIKVRNPWGKYGLTETGDVTEGGTGEFWLGIAQFMDRFSSISISGKKNEWVQ